MRPTRTTLKIPDNDDLGGHHPLKSAADQHARRGEGGARKLDAIDLNILRSLSRNGRLTNSELAQEVGLSPSPCWQRTRRLESEGFIVGYAAQLDQAMLGFPETVIIEVTLERHDDRVVEAFGKAMIAMDEVIEVFLTTGEYDYLIKVAVDGTRGYECFLREKLYKVPGIRHSRSSFALRALKRGGVCVPRD